MWVGDDPQETAQDDIGHTVRRVRVDEVAEPVGVTLVVGRVGAVGIDQDVNVGEEQGAAP
jgi:hypothetical protein